MSWLSWEPLLTELSKKAHVFLAWDELQALLSAVSLFLELQYSVELLR
jgi:hypothetical protein